MKQVERALYGTHLVDELRYIDSNIESTQTLLVPQQNELL